MKYFSKWLAFFIIILILIFIANIFISTGFFRTIENVAGEDLSWFWRGWFLENYKLDQSIDKVAYTNGKAINGAEVTLSNLDKLAMPVTISYETKTGEKRYQTEVEVHDFVLLTPKTAKV